MPEKNDKIVVLYRSAKSMVTQRDLAEERALAQQEKNARSAHEHKRNEIREALEAGADVEPGLRTVRLRPRKALVIQ